MSNEAVLEDVPEFVKRDGDTFLQGSNNTIIILGTDRPAGITSGLGHVAAPNGGRGSGTIHLIAGRKGQDPSVLDKSYIYISMLSDPDGNLGTGAIEGTSSKGPS